MPIARFQMPDGRIARFEVPEGLSPEQAQNLISQQISTKPVEEAKPAPFSFKDIGLAFGQGLTGATQDISSVAGATNPLAQGLGSLQQSAGEAMTPERRAEIQRRQQIEKAAEGNTWEEIKAKLGGVAEAPLQTAATVAGGILPYVAGTLAVPEVAIPAMVARLTGLGMSAKVAQKVASAVPVTAIGGVMGLGGQKSQDYETVKRELLEKGVKEEEAEILAQKAAEYSLKNLPRQAAATAAGAFEGAIGAEGLLSRVGKKPMQFQGKPVNLPEPTWKEAITKSTIGEALPEGVQSAVGTAGTNVALTEAGIPTDISKGVLSSAVRDTLVGGLMGTAVSPLKMRELRQEYVGNEIEAQKEYQKQQNEAIAQAQKKIDEQLAATKNPLGLFTANELGPDLSKTIEQHRADTGKPPLTSYALEDIMDALPGIDKPKELESLNALITAKTGYAGETYTPTQVIELAQQKNVNTSTPSFEDFLSRTTGINDPMQMSQPQLHAAVTSLNKLPGFATMQALPEGTNATRYTPEQLTTAIDGLNAKMDLLGKDDLNFNETTQTIEAATGLKGSAVNALLNDANRSGEIVTEGNKVSVPSRTTPSGYTIKENIGPDQEVAESYDIMRGDEKLFSAPDEKSATDLVAKLERTTSLELQKVESDLKALDTKTAKSEDDLNRLTIEGKFGTPEYKEAEVKHQQLLDEAMPIIDELTAKKESYSTPLSVAPIGTKRVAPKSYEVRKGENVYTTTEDRAAAEQAIFQDLSDADLQDLSKKPSPALQQRVNAEIQRRAALPPVGAPATAATPEQQAKLDKLKVELPALLNKFGLKDVGLKVVDAIEGGADGSYQAKLIQIALSAEEPITTLRHEAIHALKELGFFTPQQWAALERQAEREWVQKYLKNVMVEVEGRRMSRYDAYANGVKNAKGEYILKPLSNASLLEEAIADAFADFDANKAPPGMLTALLNKMRNFFASLRNALTGNGFQTYEDVFGKVEKGELKSGQVQGGGKKLSVQTIEEGQPIKKVDPNDISNIVKNSPYKDAGINVLTSQIEKTSKPLEVDDVGRLFDGAYMAEFGKQGDWRNPADFKRAVVQAVDELKIQLQQSKSGLDWYDEDIAKAFELTQQFIPSLKKPEKRALFSVIAGIMSPSTTARDNWVIAAQAYQHYEKTGVLPGTNPATGNLWMGGLESANKKKQLDMLNAMLQPKSKGGLGEKGTVEWFQGSHTVAEITDFRSKYGGMGKSNVGGKATDVLPGFTAFGPKVGPFVMNINGIHEVTVDVWMTRTFNRYFGQMMGPDGKMVRAPTEPQRVAIKNLAVLAAQQLGIKPYQVQSVLWFMEQQIFNKLGTGAKSYGFSDGAIKFNETQSGVGGAKVPPANSGSNAVANQPTGQQAGRTGVQAGQPTTRTTKQGVDNATGQKLSTGEPAARPSTRGGKKFSIQTVGQDQPESTGDRRGRDQGRGLTPLAGAPIISGATGPDPKIVQVAEDYAKQYGIPYRRQAAYAEIDEDFSKLVADAYEAMPHAPRDPKVKEAYQDLVRQTRNQYDALVDAGYSFTFFDSNTDPYEGNPFNAMRDLRQNQQMAVYGTYDGYGTEGITGAAVEDNPMLEDTGLRWPDQDGVEHMVTANDLFRAVHDAFGHGLEGAGFRAQGEENAWQAHARLFTGPAVGAITSETRGQNSWLNYGPYGEKNRIAKLEDTVFAEQKTGLMPPWTWQDRLVDDEGLVLGVRQPDAISVKGLHYGKARVAELDASKYGTGLRGAERRRLERSDDERIKQRVYFYIQKPDGSTPYPESGVGQYVYTQQFDNVLGSGPTMSRLFNEANGDSNNFESLVVDAGYDGYAVPSMGMMVILNHNTPVKFKGLRSELTGDQKKLSLSKAPPDSLLTKRMSNIGIKSTDDFWKRIQNVMIGTGSRNPSLGAALDTTSTSDQVKQAISVWKQDVETSGIQNYLQKFRIQGAVPEIDDIIAGPPTVKKMLLEAGIRPTLGNAISAYNSLPKSTVDGAVNDMQEPSIKESKKSLKSYFATSREAENAAYQKAPPTTQEFKRWFGSSTVKDEGRPQVMYHGSPDIFDIFRENKPIFISPNASFAEQFGEDRAKDLGRSASDAKVYPLWVRAETPFDYENKEHVERIVQALIDKQKLIGTNPTVRLNTFYMPVDRLKKEVTSGLWSVIEDQTFQDTLKSNGFDSFNVKEGGNKNLAVFNANQVKSVTGNSGEFGETKDMRFSLRNVQDEVDTLPNGAAINSSINRITTAREQEGFFDRIMNAFKPQSVDALRQQFLNRYNQLGVYDRLLAEKMGGAALLADSSAESAALMSDNAAAIAAMACGIEGKGGIPVYNNGYTTINSANGEKGVLEILMPLAKIGDPRIYQTYQFWAGAKRGSRLLANGIDHTYTPAEIAYAKELEQKYPEFKQVQADWIKYNNGLMKFAVDTGVLSPERAAEFMRYSDYIPFYRQLDGETTIGPKLFQNISGVTPPKKLKGIKEGQEAPLADFLETLVRNTQSIIQSGMKNTAAQRAVGVAMQLKTASKRNDVSYAPGVVTVLERGKPVSYDVADQLFVDAVKSLNLPELPFLSIFAAPANLLRNMVTKDPGFMMANLMRDSLSAWVTSGAKMTPIASTISNFGKAIGGNDPAYIALRNAGVIGGYEFVGDIKNSGAVLGKALRRESGTEQGAEKVLKPFTSLWRGLEKGTEASDAATRMAIYKDVMERTGNEAEAIYRAMEVLNFNRKGNLAIVRILTAAVPFLNARMQGLDVLYRAAFGKMASADAAAIQRSFFIRGATIMALSSMYWFLTHDDDEYLKQEQETRDNNWLFPSAGIRIPIPFEVGVLFKVIPERILEYTFGNDTGKDLADSMKRNLINTFAFNPIPQTVLPLVEARTNYSFFTMRPIVGQGMEGVASEYQVAPGTSEFAKQIGKATGNSPIMIDHILQGYTGSMGMYAVDLIDAVLMGNDDSPKVAKRFEQMPIIKRFALDKEAKGTVTSYYELKNSVDEVVRTVNLMEKTGNGEDLGKYMEKNAQLFGMRSYISSVEKQMKMTREAAVQIRSSGMSPEEKRDSLLAITQAQNAMTASIRQLKKSIEQ